MVIRKNFNTITAVISFLNDIYRHLDDKYICMALLYDVSKAFDTADQLILAEKLKHQFYFSDLAIEIIYNFINNRWFKVKYDNVESMPFNVNTGVAHGSVTGQLLYILYTNDIINYIPPNNDIYTSADDTATSDVLV